MPNYATIIRQGRQIRNGWRIESLRLSPIAPASAPTASDRSETAIAHNWHVVGIDVYVGPVILLHSWDGTTHHVYIPAILHLLHLTLAGNESRQHLPIRTWCRCRSPRHRRHCHS